MTRGPVLDAGVTAVTAVATVCADWEVVTELQPVCGLPGDAHPLSPLEVPSTARLPVRLPVGEGWQVGETHCPGHMSLLQWLESDTCEVPPHELCSYSPPCVWVTCHSVSMSCRHAGWLSPGAPPCPSCLKPSHRCGVSLTAALC